MALRKKTTQRKRSNLTASETRWGLLFLSPWLIGVTVFTLLPMLATLAFSFTNFSLTNLHDFHFIGLDNYARLLTDPEARLSLGVTLKFFAIALPAAVAIPLGLAALMNVPNLWGKRFFQTMFYMPYMIPLVSIVLSWGGFLNDQTGWLNRGLEVIGINGPDWINSTTWIYPALLMVGLWGNGNAMITLLAGMQGVPTELYEAAKVDGANSLTCFFKITLPLISPIIFYNLVLSAIGLFQYFLEPFVLTNGKGDPGNATLFYNLYLYRNFFTYQDMAYGATLAWALFLLILIVTGFIFWSQKFWVFQAEER